MLITACTPRASGTVLNPKLQKDGHLTAGSRVFREKKMEFEEDWEPMKVPIVSLSIPFFLTFRTPIQRDFNFCRPINFLVSVLQNWILRRLLAMILPLLPYTSSIVASLTTTTPLFPVPHHITLDTLSKNLVIQDVVVSLISTFPVHCAFNMTATVYYRCDKNHACRLTTYTKSLPKATSFPLNTAPESHSSAVWQQPIFSAPYPTPLTNVACRHSLPEAKTSEAIQKTSYGFASNNLR